MKTEWPISLGAPCGVPNKSVRVKVAEKLAVVRILHGKSVGHFTCDDDNYVKGTMLHLCIKIHQNTSNTLSKLIKTRIATRCNLRAPHPYLSVKVRTINLGWQLKCMFPRNLLDLSLNAKHLQSLLGASKQEEEFLKLYPVKKNKCSS